MAIDFTRVRALCFDVDGTLSDTDDQWVAKYARPLQPLNWLFPQRDPDRFVRWLLMGIETPANLAYTALDWLHLDDAIGRLYNLITKLQPVKQRSFLIVPDVRETLVELHQQYPLSIISARDMKTTRAFLETFDLLGLFHSIASSQTCEYTKPFPHPVRWAAQQMGVAPEEVLMIGDTTVDIRAGRAAGAQTVGVLSGFGNEAELVRAGADLILSSSAHLPKAIRDGLNFGELN